MLLGGLLGRDNAREAMAAAHVIDGCPWNSQAPKPLTAVEAEGEPSPHTGNRQRWNPLRAEHHPGAVRAQWAEGHTSGELVAYGAWNRVGVGAGEGCDDMDAAGPTLPGEQTDRVPNPLTVGLREPDACEQISGLINHDEYGADGDDASWNRRPVVAFGGGKPLLPPRKLVSDRAQHRSGSGESSYLDLMANWGEVEFLRIDDHDSPAPAEGQRCDEVAQQARLP